MNARALAFWVYWADWGVGSTATGAWLSARFAGPARYAFWAAVILVCLAVALWAADRLIGEMTRILERRPR